MAVVGTGLGVGGAIGEAFFGAPEPGGSKGESDCPLTDSANIVEMRINDVRESNRILYTKYAGHALVASENPREKRWARLIGAASTPDQLVANCYRSEAAHHSQRHVSQTRAKLTVPK